MFQGTVIMLGKMSRIDVVHYDDFVNSAFKLDASDESVKATILLTS